MMRQARVVTCALATFAIALGLSGCQSEPDVGKVTVLIRDGSHGHPMPGDVDGWVVTISRVEIRADAEDVDEDVEDVEDMDEDGDGGWIVLRDGPMTVDLADLPNEMAMLVEGAVVPTGAYSQLRFVIDGGYLVVGGGAGAGVFATEGTVVPAALGVPGELRMPSMSTSGLKVKLPDDAIVTGDQHVLVVDFDLSQSLGHESSEDVWVMHPVVEATDWMVTAAISVHVDVAAGVVMPDGATLASFDAELVGADGIAVARAPLEDPDGDGMFEATFQWIDPRLGPFSVRLVAPDDVTFVSLPGSEVVVIGSGESIGIAFVVTSVHAN